MIKFNHAGNRNPMWGKHHTLEANKKNRKAHLGKHPTPEARRKNSEAHLGVRNHNYKGGPSWNKVLYPYLDRFEYEDLQKLVKDRDNNECQMYGVGISHTKRLVTHHIVPIEIGCKSKICDCASNFITLCHGCHRKVHGNWHTPNKWKLFLPFAKEYLSQFGYKKLLLESYI